MGAKNLKISDIVRLKSGGPAMTVQSVTEHLAEHDLIVRWQWFSGDKLQAEIFKAQSIDLEE
jgi:uncharacterized protein YodC (DUF2158 family)